MRLKIAISQRCDSISGRNEVRDSLDVMLPQLVWDLGFLPISVSNYIHDTLIYSESISPQAILLSGGNNIGSVHERDRVETTLIDYALKNNLPLVGICRGMQFINHYQGGNLRSVSNHVGSTHCINGKFSKAGIRDNSFHNQGIYASDLGTDLEALAWSDDGVIEALRHTINPWLGIMWHPERESPFSEFDKLLLYQHLTNSKLTALL